MDQSELETLIRHIDTRTRRIEERTTRIEQILPTFVTKDDTKAFATKDDVREEGERTRRHFDVVAEQLKEDIAPIAEGHKATRVYVDGTLAETRTTLDSHDKRFMKLEAKSMNTGDRPKRRSTRRDP